MLDVKTSSNDRLITLYTLWKEKISWTQKKTFPIKQITKELKKRNILK